MQDMYRITYISKNTIPNDEVSIKSQIESILNSATKNNPALGITGALLYSGGYFCQVIEGEEDNLEELFETIQMDDRHAEVTVLNYESITSRVFEEWAMAYAGIDDSQKLDLDGIKDSKDDIKLKETSTNILNALENAVLQ
ncbi:MAG: BLUF domain-containing protein [Glaciecola sp.]